MSAYWRETRRHFAKLYNFLHHGRAERELAREVSSHLALMEEDFERRGMTAQEARVAAKRAYGGVEQAKELQRDERSIVWLEQAVQDLGYAWRSLSKNPGFTLIAIVTLTLGIGVNATLFSAYNAVALKPLPVADPNKVVRMERWFASGFRGDLQYGFSYPEYTYCRDHSSLFSGLIASSWPQAVIEDGASAGGGLVRPEKVFAQLVSANYFADLGVSAYVGRTFLPIEDRTPSANPVLVISYPFWQRRFQLNRQAVGQIIKINGTEFTIVRIAEEEFTGTSTTPQVPDFWAPLSMQAQLAPGRDWLHEPNEREFQILARMKPATTLKRAQAEAGLLLQRYAATYKQRDKTYDKTTDITLQQTALFGNTDDVRFKALVAALMLVVGMVLMVACANIANMLLARGAARQREIGVRLALGASRSRVIRQLLTESTLLALIGGAGGLLASVWTTKLLWLSITRMLVELVGGGVVLAANLSPDSRVLEYAFVLSLLTGVLFGVSPALQFSRPDLIIALKDEGTSFGRRWSRSRIRSVLIATQVAVSMVLLISTGLLLRGLVRSEPADPGFETHSVFLLWGDFGSDVTKAAARERRLVDRLETLPGIEKVALGTIPMTGTWTLPIVIEGPNTSQSQSTGKTLASYASDTYLKTLGIGLLRGRDFTEREAAHSARVAIISESTARRFWPQGDPLGKMIKLDLSFDGKLTEFEVIGIAKDVRFANLTRIDPAHVYLPTGDPAARSNHGVLVRTHGNPQTAMASVRTAAGELDRNLLASLHVLSVEEGPLRVQKSLARTCALYAGILALLALTLAGMGIYGVMAYLVSQREAEIGIRMALGASTMSVLEAIVVGGLQPVFAGLLLGVAGAAALSWSLHTTLVFPGSIDFFYGVPFYDPATFLGLSCFLIFVATIASLIPARHALLVDPMVALRYE